MEALAAAFARHFFGVDAALQEYATQSVLKGLADGESPKDLAAVLQTFLLPGFNQAALDVALTQLWQASRLQAEELAAAQPGWAWAQPAAQATEAHTALGAPADDSHAGTPTAQSERRPDSAATGGKPAALQVGKALSAGAAEFRPSWAQQPAQQPAADVPLLSDALAGLELPPAGQDFTEQWHEDDVQLGAATWEDHGAWGGAASGGDWGEIEEDGSWVAHGSSVGEAHGWAAAAAAPGAAGRTERNSSGGDEWGGGAVHSTSGDGNGWWSSPDGLDDANGTASADAFLHVIAQQFPLYSSAALRQVFEQQGRDPGATIDMLCSLEAEVQGQASWRRQQAQQRRQQEPGGPDLPAFDDADFPSLSTSPASSATSAQSWAAAAAEPHPSRQGHGQRYAFAAKLGARRVEPAPGPPARPAKASQGSVASRARHIASPGIATPTGDRGCTEPAPIWESRGVQRFETGAAVAEQYAALRASARDHARLRNQFFQQATQAYLAGHKQLAKELGAKGRHHSEQMRLAHEEAAANLFASRNAGVLGTGRGEAPFGSTSGGGSGSSNVPTVDLHGLHVAEALDALDWVVAKQQRQRPRGGRLRVVVGVGQHSAAARLPAAVRRHLVQQGLRFTEPYAGLLDVEL